MFKTKAAVAFGLMLFYSTLNANSEDLAVSLMKLRSDVEKLDSAIVEQKEGYKASVKSLQRQKDELLSIVSREDLKIKQLNQEIDKIKKEIKEASKNSEGLKPVITDALDMLVANIKGSLPFKTDQRVKDVVKIKEQLESGLITPQKALSLTWNAYTDSLRMTKENGIFKQTILLNAQERLAEIARIGTMMMFFKTPDNNTLGYVVKDGDSYSYKTVNTKQESDQILALFDAFKKQIRTGYFTIPNAIASTEIK